PPKSSTKPKVERVERKPIRRDVIVQPKEIPKTKPPEAEPQKEEDEGGQEGGVEGGVKGGVVGGVVGGVLGGQLGGQLGSQVLPFGEGMTRPQRIEGRDPQYTREALEAHIAGVMLVKCVITIEGRLENCRVVKPVPFMEKAVLDALSTWRYKPVLYQGRPVSVDYLITVRLVLPQ
ncbi:MAG TPA: TonB family protein, partial [Myxococcaceae bacterium]|nr:TonB family protein [Myxococcaceae bacterium]